MKHLPWVVARCQRTFVIVRFFTCLMFTWLSLFWKSSWQEPRKYLKRCWRNNTDSCYVLFSCKPGKRKNLAFHGQARRANHQIHQRLIKLFLQFDLHLEICFLWVTFQGWSVSIKVDLSVADFSVVCSWTISILYKWLVMYVPWNFSCSESHRI